MKLENTQKKYTGINPMLAMTFGNLNNLQKINIHLHEMQQVLIYPLFNFKIQYFCAIEVNEFYIKLYDKLGYLSLQKIKDMI